MHFDADVVQFITQLQQQHGSLEPFLQQQLLLQEAHMEQQESLTNLKRMHDELSRRMEESCARAADLEGQLALAYEKRQQVQQDLSRTQLELYHNQELLQQAPYQNEQMNYARTSCSSSRKDGRSSSLLRSSSWQTCSKRRSSRRRFWRSCRSGWRPHLSAKQRPLLPEQLPKPHGRRRRARWGGCIDS